MSVAYLVDGLRTPIGRYGGSLATIRPDDLLASVISGLLTRYADLDPARIDDVVIGCANQAGEDNRNVARMAVLLAGLPVTVPGTTVNRLCGSGADAVAIAAHMIVAGDADVVVAGGVESMSRAPLVLSKTDKAFGRNQQMYDTTMGWRFPNSELARTHGVDAMGRTAENVADQFQISREDQDAFALRSQTRAAAAVANGRLAREILPLRAGREPASRVFDTDEHLRTTSADALAALRPAFAADGSVTAGNSSGINDGAAALLLASRAAVESMGLQPLAVVRSSATAGVAPRIMGMGPVPATQKLLARAGIGVADIDLFEINEAFAAQAVAVARQLGLPDASDDVNPNGGAIALGHPLGMSGARLVLTAAHELQSRQASRAVVSMCIGVGQGISLLLERTWDSPGRP